MKDGLAVDKAVAGQSEHATEEAGLAALACPICGPAESRPLFTGIDFFMGLPGRYRYVECRGCGLVRQDPRPSNLAACYPDQYQKAISVEPNSIFRRWRLKRRVDWVHQIARKTGGPVLEVGCGGGEFLEELQRRGLEVEGLDFDLNAVERARRRGIRVTPGALENATYPSGRFGLVVLRHFLEHVADPVAALHRVARWLKPKGYVLLEVPNADSLSAAVMGSYWFGYEPPRHLFAFSPRHIERLLGQAGFNAVRTKNLFSPALWGDSFRNLACGIGVKRFGWGTRVGSQIFGTLNMALSYPLAFTETCLRRTGSIAMLAVKR